MKVEWKAEQKVERKFLAVICFWKIFKLIFCLIWLSTQPKIVRLRFERVRVRAEMLNYYVFIPCFYLLWSWSQNKSRCLRKSSTDSTSIKTCICTLSSAISHCQLSLEWIQILFVLFQPIHFLFTLSFLSFILSVNVFVVNFYSSQSTSAYFDHFFQVRLFLAKCCLCKCWWYSCLSCFYQF